jgi:small conductance mechanosensitive channel
MKELFTSLDQELIALWGLKIVYAVAIFIVGLFLVRIISSFTMRLLAHKVTDNALLNFVRTVMKLILMVVVAIAALDQLGVDTTSLVAVVGAAGLAIGLALKDSMQNVASGIMLIMMRPFKAGDYVEAGGTSGTVEKIGLFTSVFCTPDNREVTIPNSAIVGDSITNFSARDSRRLDLVFGIHYDDDITLARQIILDVLASEKRLLKEPKPVVAVAELGASSVDFVVRPWVAACDYWPTRFDLIENIKLAFDRNGITIPFPQQDVHYYGVPGEDGEIKKD